MSTSEKVIVIPARFASKRFPGKMLARIGAKSLLQHTFENAKKSQKIQKILIATDHDDIYEEAKAFGAQVVMTPKEIANGTKRVHFALHNSLKLKNDAIIINIQGDEPTLSPQAIDNLCEEMEKDPSLMMATLVTPITVMDEIYNPSTVKCVFNKDLYALYFSRSPIPYSTRQTTHYQHIGVYAFRRSFLDIYNQLPPSPLDEAEDLEQLKVLENGHRIKIVVDHAPSVGVDTPEDLNRVKEILCL